MTDTAINGMIFLTLGLTYMGVATRAHLLSIIAVVFALVLAFEFADWYSVGFVALAIFNGANAMFGMRGGR